MVRHRFPVLVGSIPTPKFFMNDLKNFEGGQHSYKTALRTGGTELLKKRDFVDCSALYELMSHPDVFPYVRQKVDSYEEYVFATKQTIESEDAGELISRTIIDEWDNPIGSISLYDIKDQAGFLGTWLGKPYHGKGYNVLAKEAFFKEIFFELNIETVFMRIRKKNIRSIESSGKVSLCYESK